MESTADEVPLNEDAATVRLLISGMYDTCSQVSWSTVEPLFEMARKYDVEDIQLSCECFLSAEELGTSCLPRYMELGCRFGVKPAVERCQQYVATADNFDDLVR